MAGPSSRDAEIFAEALKLPAAERAAYLERECAGDAVLRQRIEELLQTQGRVGDFLESTGQGTEAPAMAALADDGTSGRVGRYRLITKIGEGGCGVVYLAEQDEPVRRQVAVKIIKPGMDTREVIARFEAERQALALMDHPGIAKVFDAGETQSGRPYFVMELIRGVKITDYCDQNALTTGERLELFVHVCQAIQHAHQKGVIHRDIKPSNILVSTLADGARQPVVIDFGIAKATVDTRLTDKTLFTAVDMLLGTPTYMSPEQTAVSSADVDTRSDIYSLGVLLYELLTGTTPFDAGELLQLGIDEVRRAIREREPLRPSARLGRMTKEQLTTIAQKRRAEPPTLIRSVRGDLDWIAMKALEKERARRYETASGLALDVTRYLADETVSARPASAFYRFRKTVARNKTLFASLTVIVVLLAGSLVMVTNSLAQERRARSEADEARRQAETDKTQAQAQATKSQQVTRFLENMLKGVSPQVAQGRDTTMLREILDQAVVRVGKELATQPGTRSELQRTIGSVYQQLGLYDAAIAQYRAALAGAEEAFGPESAEVATVLDFLGSVLVIKHQVDDAEAQYSRALAIQRKLHGSDHPAVAKALRSRAAALMDQGKLEETSAHIREAVAILRKHLGDDHTDTLVARYGLAIVAYNRLEYAEAEAHLLPVLAAWRKAEPSSQKVISALSTLTTMAAAGGKPSQAEPFAREALAIQRKLYGDAHPGLVDTHFSLGYAYIRENRQPEAEASCREALTLGRKTLGPEAVRLLPTMMVLSWAIERQGRMDEAVDLARETLQMGRKQVGPENPQLVRALGRLTDALVAAGKFDEADRAIADYAPADFSANPDSVNFVRIRAHYQALRGRWPEALADATLTLRYDPDHIEAARVLAPLLALHGQTEAYGRHCRDHLAKFGRTETPLMAAWVAWDCGLLASPDVDLAAVARLAAVATAGNLEGNWPGYAWCGRALVEYRLGNFAAAAESAARVADSPRVDLRVMALAVSALAQARQNRPAEARAALTAARALAASGLPAPDGRAFGPEREEWIPKLDGFEWRGVVGARVLLAEAAALIEPTPTTPAVTSL